MHTQALTSLTETSRGSLSARGTWSFDGVPFWSNLWPALVAALVATLGGGALLLTAGYFLVDRRLHLRDRADRAAEEEQRSTSLRRSSLHIAHEELKSIAANIPVFRAAIDEDKVPYPPFDENGWTLLPQAHALATLQPTTAEALMQAYNRIRSANGQMTEFADLTTGPTAALVTTALTSASDSAGQLPPLAADMRHAYDLRRSDLRRGLRARLADLRDHANVAIDAIEAELGNALEVPAAQREYVRWQPVHDLGEGG